MARDEIQARFMLDIITPSPGTVPRDTSFALEKLP